MLAQIAAVAGRGGTYVGVEDRGIDVARAAGLSTATESRPNSLLVPGALLGVTVDGDAPLGFGMASTGFAFDANDPVLAAPASARVAARFPSAIRISGFAEGTDRLAGSAAALVDGRAALFAFDPVLPRLRRVGPARARQRGAQAADRPPRRRGRAR